MMRTNSKTYLRNIREYILECVEDPDNELTTPKEKVDYIFTEFDRVFNHKPLREIYPNEQTRLAQFLMGLPFNLAYQYGDILKVAARLHEIPEIPPAKENVICDSWYTHLAYHILKMREDYQS